MYLPGVRRQEYSVVDVKEEDTRAFIEDTLVYIALLEPYFLEFPSEMLEPD